MRVGFVGTGKLGFMVALTVESCGHEVKGYDVSPLPAEYLAARRIPFTEEHADELLQSTHMEMVALEELCDWADILFLAPQTPHEPQYEGATPLPETRADFDYSYLKACAVSVDCCLTKPKVCVIISTVLPGTIAREILPIVSLNFRVVYSPQFIAMGTVHEDFLNPEFWLIGSDDAAAVATVSDLYRTIAFAPEIITDIRTAEGIKVFYNTFITAKTVLANLYGEMAHRLGMNVDEINTALVFSTRRLISSRYLKAGMGDGGGCHPRDNIALSYIARKLGMRGDFFTDLMQARQDHTEFLADLIEQHRSDLPVYILGSAFKPETNIETGSPARLLSAILSERGIQHSISDRNYPTEKALYFIGCQHECFRLYKFPEGSVIIDPFRYLSEYPGTRVIGIGSGDSFADAPLYARSCS